jgi:hypothetical protein
VQQLAYAPGRLLRLGPAALAVLTGIAVRTVMQVLLLASLGLGLCFVPEVNARVPAAKEFSATAASWVEYAAQNWRSALLGSPVTNSQAAPRLAPSAARPPKPAQFVATQAVLFDSTPGGAIVRLGTRTVGKTPMTLRLAPGTYKVTISRPGYASVTRTITVRQGTAAALGVQLVAAPTVTSSPSQSPVDPRRSRDGKEQQSGGDQP